MARGAETISPQHPPSRLCCPNWCSKATLDGGLAGGLLWVCAMWALRMWATNRSTGSISIWNTGQGPFGWGSIAGVMGRVRTCEPRTQRCEPRKNV